MHEFSICENIIKIALTEAEHSDSLPKRILKTVIVVGALHQIINHNLQFGYKILSEGTLAEGSILEIITEEIKIVCKECLEENIIEGDIFICPSCSSGRIEVTAGKSLYLKDLEVEI